MTNVRKLSLALLVALACCALGITVLPASAAPAKHPQRSGAKAKGLRVDSIKVGTKAGPLVVRVAADAQSRVSMTVNGRRVKTPFEFAGPKAQAVELRALGDGLRRGVNKLRIRSVRAGVVRKASRTVTVPGWALLADAGEDTGTPTHVYARLGTPPLPAAGPAPAHVDYSWHIADAPTGARAGLVDAGAARPVLKTKRAGTYVLQLEANPEGNDEPTSFDRVTVAVAPNDPPIGAPINTLTNGQILIAGQGYGGATGEASNYVVLERATRAVVASGQVANDAGGINKLTDLANTYGSGGNYMRYLMIVSGPGGIPAPQLDSFANLLKKLGVALPSPESFFSLRSKRAYSVIGIPGAPAGAATTRFPTSTDPSAAITGYLQPNQAVTGDGTPVYEYVAGEMPSYDTKADGSTDTTDKMVIGGTTYSNSLPGSTTAGFHVVILNSFNLQLVKDEVLATNGTGNDRAAQGAAAGELTKQINTTSGSPLLFIQTIGKPAAAGPEWQQLVNTMVRLGANANLLNALNGTSEYALVGRVGSKAPPAEASTAYDVGPYEAPSYPPARLIGTLARSRTSNFDPNLSGTPSSQSPDGGMNLELTKIAYQAQQAWPALPGTADESAKAEKVLCEGMKFCQGANSCPTVRECFWQRYSADWGLKLQLLDHVDYPGDGRGFSKETFEGVKKELYAETADVVNVINWLTKLQEPFEKSDLSSYIDLQGISKKIYDSVQPPPEDNSTSWALGLVSKIVLLGSAAPPPARYAAAGISAVFGLASYLSNKSGQPILGSEITARSQELGSELVSRIELARKTTVGLGMMIVSDYGKLAAADRHVDGDWALPADISPAINAYRTSAKQWFYEALIPTTFQYLIRANTNNARYLDCDGSDRWPNQPDMFQMNATVGYDGNGKPITADFFFTKGRGGAASPNASIGDEMFRPRNSSDPGLGIEKLQFFSPRVFNGRIYHALDHTPKCTLGFLPLLN